MFRRRYYLLHVVIDGVLANTVIDEKIESCAAMLMRMQKLGIRMAVINRWPATKADYLLMKNKNKDKAI